MARAARQPFADRWCEPATARLCGLDPGSGSGVAALSYLQDFASPAPQGCLRADPVHLRADTSGLILFDSTAFSLTDQESEALTTTLNEHLAVDGCRIVRGHPKRWYLVSERPPRLDTPALPQVRGRRLAATPYTGADAALWTGRSNEIQMLLHSHPVNQQRAREGQPAINGLWLWGAGEIPAPTSAGTPDRLLSDSPYTLGVARHLGLAQAPLPAGAEEFLSAAATGEHSLIDLQTCRDAAAYQQFDSWQSALCELERGWFAPLLAALRARRVDTLNLYPLNGFCYRLTRAGLRAFWKGGGDYRRVHGFRCAGAERV